ncbi:MAG TPA: divergent polysaccharide deacetylase family protein [bacterium]|nr:divergent polysaccharide deacetylase family protein [bacterium]
MAIIFDDAGGSLEDLEEIIALRRPVTVAILPGLRYSKEVAARAQAAGLEVFLHLPLEPEDPTKAMGPGGIAVSMSDAEIEASVRESLAAMPGVVGVNNHMGSRGTADPRVMRAVLRVVKEQHLLFVDSVTTPRSIAGVLASEMRIPSASREVFLDNEDDAGAIRAQLRRALTRARRKGRAVAIGHASRLTAQVLAEMLGEFDRAGIALVPASALAR